MKKISIILCMFLILSTLGCRTKSYNTEKAIANGEIVFDGSRFHNLNRLEDFIENVNSETKDKIRITKYGDEGMFLIEDITYDGKRIIAEFDSTMAIFSSDRKKEKKEYISIKREEEISDISGNKVNVVVYYLIGNGEKVEILRYLPDKFK